MFFPNNPMFEFKDIRFYSLYLNIPISGSALIPYRLVVRRDMPLPESRRFRPGYLFLAHILGLFLTFIGRNMTFLKLVPYSFTSGRTFYQPTGLRRPEELFRLFQTESERLIIDRIFGTAQQFSQLICPHFRIKFPESFFPLLVPTLFLTCFLPFFRVFVNNSTSENLTHLLRERLISFFVRSKSCTLYSTPLYFTGDPILSWVRKTLIFMLSHFTDDTFYNIKIPFISPFFSHIPSNRFAENKVIQSYRMM